MILHTAVTTILAMAGGSFLIFLLIGCLDTSRNNP